MKHICCSSTIKHMSFRAQQGGSSRIQSLCYDRSENRSVEETKDLRLIGKTLLFVLIDSV